MTSGLYLLTVRHRRHHPRVHEFSYRTWMLLLDLDPAALSALDAQVRAFSVNRWNLCAFHDRDHIDGRGGVTRDKVRQFLAASGCPLPDGRIALLTGPRLLGLAFNPISLYYCFDPAGALAAVVAEVDNTFGARYLYLLRHPENATSDPTAPRRYRHPKVMHVSPFVGMAATYEFHVSLPGDRVSVGIVEHEDGRHILDAQLWGHRVPLTAAALGRALLTRPATLLTPLLPIHWEAVRLWRKGLGVHRAPAPSPEQRAQRALLAGLGSPRPIGQDAAGDGPRSTVS